MAKAEIFNKFLKKKRFQFLVLVVFNWGDVLVTALIFGLFLNFQIIFGCKSEFSFTFSNLVTDVCFGTRGFIGINYDILQVKGKEIYCWWPYLLAKIFSGITNWLGRRIMVYFKLDWRTIHIRAMAMLLSDHILLLLLLLWLVGQVV